jgi:hypothetical protein
MSRPQLGFQLAIATEDGIADVGQKFGVRRMARRALLYYWVSAG